MATSPRAALLPDEGRARLAGIEGLRAIAASVVFFVHVEVLTRDYVVSGSSTEYWVSHLQDMGSMGVDVFFILSGYLIYGNVLRRPTPFRPFMARRIQRIYPPFAVMLAIYVVASVAVSADSRLSSSPVLWPFEILVSALLLPGVLPIENIVLVGWTLSFEMFFYLCVPLIVNHWNLRDRSQPDRVRFWWRFGAILSLFVLPVNSPHQRMVMFVAGILVWEYLAGRQGEQVAESRARRLDALGAVGLVLALVGAFFLGLGDYNGLPRIAVLAATLPFTVGAAAHGSGAFNRLLSTAPMRAVGNMSYSYYLAHAFIITVCAAILERVLDPAGQNWLYWALLAPMYLVTLVGSYVLYYFVEWPYSIRRKPIPLLSPWLAARRGDGVSAQSGEV